jgi:hypothetical protein
MKATETGRDVQGCIGNDAAFSMSFVQTRAVAGGVRIKGTGVPITLMMASQETSCPNSYTNERPRGYFVEGLYYAPA